jgi:hypothetical protein
LFEVVGAVALTALPWSLVTASVRTPVEPAAVPSPVIEIVWSPVFVPLDVPEPDGAPMAAGVIGMDPP